MIVAASLLSERLRNRATVIRMLASGEWTIPRTEMRAEMREIAAELDADAERAMRLEIRRAEAQ